MTRRLVPTPPRLVSISEFQAPDPACLALLRRLHPRLELVCLKPGVWWIGEVNPTTAAVIGGQNRRAALMARVRDGLPVRSLSFWKAELQAQGFRVLAMLNTPIPTPTQCYVAVAPTLRVTPRQVDRVLDEAIKEASGVNKREASTKWLREDYARHHGRDAYRHAFHRPIFSLPGARP